MTGQASFPEFGRSATLSEDPNILLDKYHVGFCLLRKGARWAEIFPMPSWRKVDSDDVAEVFSR